jgi:hypothetical protein
MILRMGDVVSGVLEVLETCREIPSPFMVDEASLAHGLGDTESLDWDVTSS